MNTIPIIIKNTNLEILAKIIDATAKHFGCHVSYASDDNRLEFHGDKVCCMHITQETLALFPESKDAHGIFVCPEE